MAQANLKNCDNWPPDEEPKLKYDRMSNGDDGDLLKDKMLEDMTLKDILMKDAVSCLSVHTKFICLGTQCGTVYLLDHDGYIVPLGAQYNQKKEEKYKGLRAHKVAVNQIAVDQNGEFIATCSDDGNVQIYGIDSTENNYALSLGRVIKSVALDPNYFKPGSGRRFLTGDSKLILHEKTFLSRLRSTVLCEAKGYVQAMAWQDRFIAWTSDIRAEERAGVRVFDLTARCSLGLIAWERNKSRPIENFRCNLLWASQRLLMIGWIDTIRICMIRKRTTPEILNSDDTEYLVDPMYTYQTDYYICGLGPFNDQLVILGFPKETEDGKSQRPILCVADYKESFVEISTDDLNIKGFESYSCNDYHLATLIEENKFFIVSPKDIIVASPFDIDDRVLWHINLNRHEKAISLLENDNEKSTKHSIVKVGILYIDHLIEEKSFEDAAKQCVKFCTNNKKLWEEQIYKFRDSNQLRVVSAYMPKTIDFRLTPQVYEMVLYEFLKLDSHGFLKLVQEWSPLLYRTQVITQAVIDHLFTTDVDKEIYLESLAVLYCIEKRYNKALPIYLKLKHKDVFHLIREHKMFNAIHDKILALMTLDSSKAIAILLEAKIPADIVEKQLEKHDKHLYSYLDEYCKIDPNGKYDGRLVDLYSKHCREKLLPFLKRSDNYPIKEALSICEENNFYPEMVYLLGRIGSTMQALRIILEKQGDINRAIEFCQERNDKELWLELIKHSLEKPEYISLLLQRIGNYIDPRILIRDIKPNCEINDLKESLCKMMNDYNIHLSEQQACKAITLQNYFGVHEKLIRNHLRGISVSDDFLCSNCDLKIIVKEHPASDWIVYSCHHAFHIGCLPDGMLSFDQCVICCNLKI